ncbi:MAG: alpha/beta fold hydrolase [Acidobacteriota bacterium]
MARLGKALPPSRLYLALEGRAVYEYAASIVTMPLLLDGPAGDGHPVLVLPGFIASGVSTRPLRTYLHRKGYNSHCWKQGRNYGTHAHLEGPLLDRLTQIHERYGRRVSLVGWSLGGVFSRYLANRAPERVRQVITLGSPFTNNPKANHSWKLFETLSGKGIEDIDSETFELVRNTPPVPTTCIYSRTDGITAWECCVDREGELCENVEVTGSHCGLGVNPLALHVIADRLAQPEDGWQRFRRSGFRRYLFPRPVVQRAAWA